jgi:hypothetical protein
MKRSVLRNEKPESKTYQQKREGKPSLMKTSLPKPATPAPPPPPLPASFSPPLTIEL